MWHHDTPPPNKNTPNPTPGMNLNHLTSMTLTFLYSEQPSHPLMCDLWSMMPLVNMEWRRVGTCWGWGWGGWTSRRETGPLAPTWGLNVKAKYRLENTRSAHTCFKIARPVLRSKYHSEMDPITAGNRSLLLRHDRMAGVLIWNASRAWSTFCKWVYLERFVCCKRQAKE